MRSGLRGRRAARRASRDGGRAAPGAGPAPAFAEALPVDIQPNDPILTFFQNASGPVELDKLRLESPGLDALRAAGVKLAVPLVSQGELIGLLNLGPRMSEQEYSADDRKLLENLAAQAAPAVRVAQLVKEQEAEIRTRERYQQELQIAHLIQQNFLPQRAPDVDGWQLTAFYRSAREVGGDFYDFIELPDGKVGIVVGDVTDKGVPAALVMASTRSVVRGVAETEPSPGAVLARANDLLCPDMPPKMFVTCSYSVIDPASGAMRFANAGHPLPFRRGEDGTVELRARGMPLGLMPGMEYEEGEVEIRPGDVLLFTSDGVIEAHDSDGEMYGCPRLMELVRGFRRGDDLRDVVLSDLDRFTGPDVEQEDDITLVVLERTGHDHGDFERPAVDAGTVQRTLAEFETPSAEGNEREVMNRVAEVVAGIVPASRLDKLKTAVAEAAMNAIEHGNESNPELSVLVTVTADDEAVRVRIRDEGGGKEVTPAATPDLEAKLAGEQTPRGWGLFLIKNMVDEMNVSHDERHHTVELVMRLAQGEGS